MLDAVNARARGTIKWRPKPLKGKQGWSVSRGQAALKSNLGAFRKHDSFFSNKLADADRTVLLGKALRMSRRQDFNDTRDVVAQRTRE